MENFCPSYIGEVCVNGTCSIACKEDYEEMGIPLVRNCNECPYYKGCKDCALGCTSACIKNRKTSENIGASR